MPAARHDIYIEQGATFPLDMVWKDSEGKPVDLTPFTAKMQLRERHSGDVLIECAPVLGGAAGTILVVIDAIQTAALKVPQGVYDLELHRIGDPLDVTRLIEGKFTVSPEVTK